MFWFPGSIGDRVSLPLDVILVSSSPFSVVKDHFDFIYCYDLSLVLHHTKEDLEVHVMEMRKKLLGAEHPNTLSSMANLAGTYRNQRRWNDAEQLEVQII